MLRLGGRQMVHVYMVMVSIMEEQLDSTVCSENYIDCIDMAGDKLEYQQWVGEGNGHCERDNTWHSSERMTRAITLKTSAIVDSFTASITLIKTQLINQCPETCRQLYCHLNECENAQWIRGVLCKTLAVTHAVVPFGSNFTELVPFLRSVALQQKSQEQLIFWATTCNYSNSPTRGGFWRFQFTVCNFTHGISWWPSKGKEKHTIHTYITVYQSWLLPSL